MSSEQKSDKSWVEVERKFKLKKSIEQILTNRGAKFVDETVLKDIYYDLPEHTLTLANNWLRKRNGKFELKRPVSGVGLGSSVKHVTRAYEELVGIEAIVPVLHTFVAKFPPSSACSSDSQFEAALAAHSFKPFADYSTVRRSFQRNHIHIVLDVASFGPMLAEVEVMIPRDKASSEAVEKATNEILDFAKEHGLLDSSEAIEEGKTQNQEQSVIEESVKCDTVEANNATDTNHSATAQENSAKQDPSTTAASNSLSTSSAVKNSITALAQLANEPGKLESYLLLHDPRHLQLLIDKAVLPDLRQQQRKQ